MTIEEKRKIAESASLSLFDSALRPYSWYAKSSLFNSGKSEFTAVRVTFKDGATIKRDSVERAVKIACTSNFPLDVACMAFVGQTIDAGLVVFMIKSGDVAAMQKVREQSQNINSRSRVYYPVKV